MRHTKSGEGRATISVLSYNLKDYGKSAVDTRRQQHQLLRFTRPDVVCLQEIWDDSDDLSVLDRHVATLADALGMDAMVVPARRTHCHLAILWRPEFTALSQRSHDLGLWHGLGVVQLDIGAAVPLRVAVTHLAPWDPEKRLADAHTIAGQLRDPGQATVIAGDFNSFGADNTYDPEPDWSKLPPQKSGDTSDGAMTQTFRRGPTGAPPNYCVAAASTTPPSLCGLHGRPPAATWVPTLSRRLDAFWTTRPHALRGYQVIDTPTARQLSDHLPIRIDLDPKALVSDSAGGAP